MKMKWNARSRFARSAFYVLSFLCLLGGIDNFIDQFNAHGFHSVAILMAASWLSGFIVLMVISIFVFVNTTNINSRFYDPAVFSDYHKAEIEPTIIQTLVGILSGLSLTFWVAFAIGTFDTTKTEILGIRLKMAFVFSIVFILLSIVGFLASIPVANNKKELDQNPNH
ncbi:MAG: hypothetical protein CEN89_461 [Candidatus Berkelbacteria bacterium Licking1014_7]|uniref:Uncharacterized protein n=1 Tax=Candidatus Berkelbacteria bacterium Licking1014_7 TaxID=2017147 RepID=A0A554LJE6_9BACT|nr:MAG: hypothetical protein CEN89_461 [Candidatus Berkelbacteria bacterium Licking1014_7]